MRIKAPIAAASLAALFTTNSVSQSLPENTGPLAGPPSVTEETVRLNVKSTFCTTDSHLVGVNVVSATNVRITVPIELEKNGVTPGMDAVMQKISVLPPIEVVNSLFRDFSAADITAKGMPLIQTFRDAWRYRIENQSTKVDGVNIDLKQVDTTIQLLVSPQPSRECGMPDLTKV